MNEEKVQIIKDDKIDIRALFNLLWNDRKHIIWIAAAITFLGVIYAFLATPYYKSTITMYPAGQSSSGQLSQLRGMASTFGFDIGSGEPSFHIPEIVKSRRIRTELIYHMWNTDKFDKPVNLIEYWEVGETDALLLLNGRIFINQGKTGLISIEILMEEPQLAADIANIMYPAIVDFTIESYSQQAKLNRVFIENRQIELKEQLTQTEETLREFRERNRSIMESPYLELELERLMREVEVKTQVYITLQQQYELARIDEVKETPSVIILDEGRPAVAKEKPNRKLIVNITMFFGVIVGIGFVLIKRIFNQK